MSAGPFRREPLDNGRDERVVQPNMMIPFAASKEAKRRQSGGKVMSP